MAESEWAGRITLAESESASFTLAESESASLIRIVESYALVAAVRNLVYHRHQLVLGAPDSSAHAWEKTVLGWTTRGAYLGLA